MLPPGRVAGEFAGGTTLAQAEGKLAHAIAKTRARREPGLRTVVFAPAVRDILMNSGRPAWAALASQ
jgi:hypothetical protein